MTSGMTASDCGPGYYYGKGSGKSQRGSQSDEYTMQTSTKAWVHRLAENGFLVTSVPGTWHRLTDVVPSA